MSVGGFRLQEVETTKRRDDGERRGEGATTRRGKRIDMVSISGYICISSVSVASFLSALLFCFHEQQTFVLH